MASEMQNSNPTILNAADLPTRLRSSSTKKPGAYGGIFASAIPSFVHSTDPFSTSPYSSSESESDDDELLEEPIDEQEIYGKKFHLVEFPVCRIADISYLFPQI
jgi:hypothetical protein